LVKPADCESADAGSIPAPLIRKQNLEKDMANEFESKKHHVVEAQTAERRPATAEEQVQILSTTLNGS
jgi:hypothetical protein